MGREDDGAMSILSVSLSPESPTCTGWCENIYLTMTMIFFRGTLYSALDVQSGAADRSLGFEDEDLRSSPGLLGQ